MRGETETKKEKERERGREREIYWRDNLMTKKNRESKTERMNQWKRPYLHSSRAHEGKVWRY